MLKVGVQTKGLIEESDIEQGFAKIKEAGFDCIDFNLDEFLRNTDIYQGRLNAFFDSDIKELWKYFQPYVIAMEKYQIFPSQMHAPYPIRIYGKEKQNAYMMCEVIPKSLVLAGYMKIPYVVLHPIKLQYIKSREEERIRNIEYFRTLIPLAKENRVHICFENLYEGMGNRIVEGVCANPKEAVWYIDTLNEIAGEDIFAFCLDTGHMNLVKRNAYETILQLGHRLKILHIHENDRIGDLHQLPYTFQGEGDGDGLGWEGFIQGLKETKYEGVLSFETFPCINSFPVASIEQLLKTIEQIGRYFAEEIG